MISSNHFLKHLVFLILVSHISPGLCTRKKVDMTYSFNNETRYFPGNLRFILTQVHYGMQDGGFWLDMNNFEGCEHGGTHIDAPSHFNKAGWKLHEIPLDRLIRPVVVIDIIKKAKQDPDSFLDVEDIEEWEKVNGPIPTGGIVLMNSGWQEYYHDDELYFGRNFENSSFKENTNRDGSGWNPKLGHHFPGFSPQAASWLVDKREVVGLGSDTASLDNGPSEIYKAHQIVQDKNVWILEMVANVAKIPVKGATLWVMPMKIENGSGGPTRLLAVWDEEDEKKKKDDDENHGNRLYGPTGLLVVVLIWHCLYFY